MADPDFISFKTACFTTGNHEIDKNFIVNIVNFFNFCLWTICYHIWRQQSHQSKFLFGCDGWSSHCINKGYKPSNKNELDDELPHDNQSEPGQMLPNLDTETDIHVQSDDFVAFWIYHGQLVDQFYIRFDHDRSSWWYKTWIMLFLINLFLSKPS
jgi:hypothetical protein